MAKPEKLNIWDRIFNPTRKEIIKQGRETWCERSYSFGIETDSHDYQRDYVLYKIINRVTGSETIKKEYLS